MIDGERDETEREEGMKRVGGWQPDIVERVFPSSDIVKHLVILHSLRTHFETSLF